MRTEAYAYSMMVLHSLIVSLLKYPGWHSGNLILIKMPIGMICFPLPQLDNFMQEHIRLNTRSKVRVHMTTRQLGSILTCIGAQHILHNLILLISSSISSIGKGQCQQLCLTRDSLISHAPE